MINLTHRPLRSARPPDVIIAWGFLGTFTRRLQIPGRQRAALITDFARLFHDTTLGFTAYLALAVFSRVGGLLMIFLGLHGIGQVTRHGLPLSLPSTIAAAGVADLHAGRSVSLNEAGTVIDPAVDPFLIVGTRTPDLVSEIIDFCAGAHSPGQKRYVILVPDDGDSYQDMVSAYDRLMVPAAAAACVPILTIGLDKTSPAREWGRLPRPWR